MSEEPRLDGELGVEASCLKEPHDALTPLNKMDFRQTEIYSVVVTQQNQELLRKSKYELEEVVRKIVNGLGIHRMPVLLALPEVLRLRIGVPAKLNTWLTTLSIRQDPRMGSLESIIAIEGITYGIRVHVIEDLIDILVNDYRIHNILLLKEFEKEDLETLCEKMRETRAAHCVSEEVECVERFIKERLPNITLISSTVRIRDIIQLFMAPLNTTNTLNPWSSAGENAATTESCTTIEWDETCGGTSAGGHNLDCSSSFEDILVNSSYYGTNGGQPGVGSLLLTRSITEDKIPSTATEPKPKRADTAQNEAYKSELMSESSERTDRFAEVIHSEFARNISRIKASPKNLCVGPTNEETIQILESKYNLVFVESLYHLSVNDLKDIMLREKLPLAVYLTLKKYCSDYRGPEARLGRFKRCGGTDNPNAGQYAIPEYQEPTVDVFLNRVGTKYCHPLNEIIGAKRILIENNWITTLKQLHTLTPEYVNEFPIPPSLMTHILESLDDPTILSMDKVNDTDTNVDEVKEAIDNLSSEVPPNHRVDVMQSFSRLFQHLLLTPEDTTKRVIKKENAIYQRLQGYSASKKLLLAIGYTEHEKCYLLPVLYLERTRVAHQHLAELCVKARNRPESPSYMKLLRGII